MTPFLGCTVLSPGFTAISYINCIHYNSSCSLRVRVGELYKLDNRVVYIRFSLTWVIFFIRDTMQDIQPFHWLAHVSKVSHLRKNKNIYITKKEIKKEIKFTYSGCKNVQFQLHIYLLSI